MKKLLIGLTLILSTSVFADSGTLVMPKSLKAEQGKELNTKVTQQTINLVAEQVKMDCKDRSLNSMQSYADDLNRAFHVSNNTENRQIILAVKSKLYKAEFESSLCQQ